MAAAKLASRLCGGPPLGPTRSIDPVEGLASYVRGFSRQSSTLPPELLRSSRGLRTQSRGGTGFWFTAKGIAAARGAAKASPPRDLGFGVQRDSRGSVSRGDSKSLISALKIEHPKRDLQEARIDLSQDSHRKKPPCYASGSCDGAAAIESARQLLVPVRDLVGARIVYATAPSMGHNQEGHPEGNQRVPAIVEALKAARLTPEARGSEVVRLEGFAAALPDEVAAVHSAGYVRGLERAMERAAEDGLILVEYSGPTYATAYTYSECMLAAGAGLALIDSVVAASQETDNPPVGFALVRPPGHHAVPQGPMGFCLVDHIAVAARYVQQRHGLQRVMIVDYDVHHGNGTHDMFFADPDIFFLSTHQVGSYPGTGRPDEVGEGLGQGTTLNLPLPGGAGDGAMALVMDEVIAEAAGRFKPDIILVSAGFDAHFQDPLAGLQFTTGTYHRLASHLHQLAKQLCGGRLLFFLEGGYDLQSLSDSVTDSFRAILHEETASPLIDNPAMLYEEPSSLVRDAINRIRSIHSL